MRRAGRLLKAETFVTDGIRSFVDWPMFTWLFGWTGLFVPFLAFRRTFARLAMISFAFMLNDVPAPAWMTSSRKSVSNLPSENSSAALIMALLRRGGMCFKFVFVCAAANFTKPRDFRKTAGALMLEIWKLASALVVNPP